MLGKAGRFADWSGWLHPVHPHTKATVGVVVCRAEGFSLDACVRTNAFAFHRWLKLGFIVPMEPSGQNNSIVNNKWPFLGELEAAFGR